MISLGEVYQFVNPSTSSKENNVAVSKPSGRSSSEPTWKSVLMRRFTCLRVWCALVRPAHASAYASEMSVSTHVSSSRCCTIASRFAPRVPIVPVGSGMTGSPGVLGSTRSRAPVTGGVTGNVTLLERVRGARSEVLDLGCLH